MKIIFMGTPEFAVPSLKALINSKHKIVAVVTQPDKPVGRSKSLQPSPIKELAMENNLQVLQFTKIRTEGVEIIQNLDADIIVTCAFGQILNAEILFAKKFGVINVHGSILPKYRGASPIQSAIIKGETKTGVSILKSDIGIDDGDVLLIKELDILENETYGELSIRLANLGADALLESLELLESGKAIYTPQKAEEATHCSMFKSDFGHITFDNKAQDIVNLINGLNPSPVAFMYVKNFRYKLYNAHIVSEDKIKELGINLSQHKIGEVVVAKSKVGLYIKAIDGVVSIDKIQAENGKVLTAKEFLNGGKILVGDIVDNE